MKTIDVIMKWTTTPAASGREIQLDTRFSIQRKHPGLQFVPVGKDSHGAVNAVAHPVTAGNDSFAEHPSGRNLIEQAEGLLKLASDTFKADLNFALDVFTAGLGPHLLYCVELPLQFRADFIDLSMNQARAAQQHTRITVQLIHHTSHDRASDPARRRLQTVDISLFPEPQRTVDKNMTEAHWRLH